MQNMQTATLPATSTTRGRCRRAPSRTLTGADDGAMVNPSKVLKARKSKRQTLHDKHKIEKKVREHHRKLRRDVKRNPHKHRKKKDPGIPNSWPFKMQLLQEAEARRATEKEAHAAAREARIRDRKLARQADAALQAASRLTAQQRREARRAKEAFAPLHDVLADADVVLFVLDARDPPACRSPALELALLECGKLPVPARTAHTWRTPTPCTLHAARC